MCLVAGDADRVFGISERMRCIDNPKRARECKRWTTTNDEKWRWRGKTESERNSQNRNGAIGEMDWLAWEPYSRRASDAGMRYSAMNIHTPCHAVQCRAISVGAIELRTANDKLHIIEQSASKTADISLKTNISFLHFVVTRNANEMMWFAGATARHQKCCTVCNFHIHSHTHIFG